MNTMTTEICIAGVKVKKLADDVSRWVTGIDPKGQWDVKAVSPSAIGELPTVAPITIVHAYRWEKKTVQYVRRVAQSLAELQPSDSGPAFVILHSGTMAPQDVDARVQFLQCFREPSRVEFASGESDMKAAIQEVLSKLKAQHIIAFNRARETTLADMLTIWGDQTEGDRPWRNEISSMIERLTELSKDQSHDLDEIRTYLRKLLAEEVPDSPQSPPRSSPLDSIAGVTTVTNDLRESSGRLSVARMAKVYEIPQKQIARLLGVTPQAVSKTPDAPSYQPCLEFLERIARLRLLLPNDDAFRKWLRTPNPRLGSSTPINYLEQGELQAIADLVDDALTGSPG